MMTTGPNLGVWSAHPLLLDTEALRSSGHRHAQHKAQGNLVHYGGVLLCWCCPRTITEPGEPALFIHQRLNFN